ncbi:putative helicase mov-10-B.1 isoform X2 [Conger conger]|uniref:putative helicase mov-10-B.1 isoform X2 n=1 Tax=Conger conger TaxID=82655 RepID=UPI002A5B0B50|nr:putative helicase mov-10-B.1 isoform X2 [Conger conger]
MASMKASLHAGLRFIEHLGERKKKTDKNELRDIYNSEFRRNRDGIKDPNFSNVLFALKKFNKAYGQRGKVYLDRKVRVVYGDQWRRPSRQKPPVSAPPLANGGTTLPPAGAVPPPPPVQPGSQAKKRLANKILQNLKENRSDFIADKQGVVITSDHKTADGRISFVVERLQEAHVVKMYIQNTGPGALNFTYYTALHRIRCFSLADEKRVTRACPLLLAPGDRYEVEVQFVSLHIGYFPATMVFEFKPDPIAKTKPFYIVRFLEAVTWTKLTVELGPVSPYKPYQSSTYRPVDTMVEEGEPPESSITPMLKTVVRLREHDYPFYLKEIGKQRVEDTEFLSPTAKQQLSSVRSLLEAPLTAKNYTKRFQLLLHLEEIQMEVDIRKYDLHNRTMTQDKQCKKLLILQVPGVAENRPSVLRGDHLRVTKAEDTEQPITVYKGYVHRVELESVKLGFSKKLVKNFISNMKFNVEFTINRYPLKLQHRAVELAIRHHLGEVLFPTGSRTPALPQPKTKLSLYDRKLENNPEQRAAVQHIVSGVSRPAPYLVFGPPGTGKTVTLVEAIKQVHKMSASACILACAPSNSAADLLCERVQEHVDANLLYRLYASSRDPRTVPRNLQKCCNWDPGQDCFLFPSRETLMSYKITVATVVTAGKLVSGGLPQGHFSHIFVDEAGHAVEPECIIGMAGLLHAETGQLVLAGDPKQLGPVLRSPLAIQHGLGLSLLERLMRDNPLYQKDEKSGRFNPMFVTKLLRNYRSHPAILRIPNELFYDGELQVFAHQELRNSYCAWEHLPKQGFPLVFHGVMGKDEREANSPSFFNVAEIQVLVDYLRKLLQTQGKKGLATLSPKDIGIIAPYRKQVEKIQKAIRSVKELNQLKDIAELKVGSVEEFQGQERRVIMVSAVRSSINYVKMDKDFSIGFLTNEKRFNVAVTRAKALLIVVGNPVILNKDPTWERFISYCCEEKGYTGFDYADAEGESDVVTRLAALSIQVEPEVEQGESKIQQHLDPEWRNEQ